MNHLSTEEIVNIEINLLQSSGKTLTTLHKHLLTGSIGNSINIFKQFDKKNLSVKLRKMIVANVQSMGTDPNANLRAFSLLVLKLIFDKNVQQQILTILKSHLHSNQTDLTQIKNIPKQNIYNDISLISYTQQKKILVQFLHALKSSATQNKIQTQCKKYPLALQLLVILWRTVLIRFKVPQADNFSKKISTTAAYEILFEFMDIFYCKSGRLYLLRDENLFIQNGYQNDNHQFVQEIVFGNYYENQDQYLASAQKLIQNPGSFNSDSLKITSSAFNACQFHIKCQNVQAINPFELVLPKGSSIIFDSTHSNNSNRNTNRSLKGSNAFQKRNFNFSSNRSQASINLQDSQCDNPTPSFNHILEDQFHDSFRPQEEVTEASTKERSIKGMNAHYIMKQSATILPVKNKILRSSMLQDLKLYHQSQKGSVQLQRQTITALGLKNENNINGFQTRDSPLDQALNISPFQNILQTHLIEQRLTHTDSNKAVVIEDKKGMKRSQSEKNNSIMKQNQLNEEDQNRQSLFSINCKKLKTSMQVNDMDFLSEKNFLSQNSFHENNLKDLCQHSSYSCSCYSSKLSRNRLESNTYTFKFQPSIYSKTNFKKKPIQNILQNKFVQNNSMKAKAKLSDQFFKKIKAKRQEAQTKSTNQKNKSDPKFKEQKNNRKTPFIKYSQFIKIDNKSISKSKTPDKSQRPFKKKTFPVNFKKLQTFFHQEPNLKAELKKFQSSKQQTKSISARSVNKFIPKDPSQIKKVNKTIQISTDSQNKNSFEAKLYTLYSSPTTPVANKYDSLHLFTGNIKSNNFSDHNSNFDPVGSGKRITNFNYFSPQSSNGFGRNDNMFFNPQIGNKGSQKH